MNTFRTIEKVIGQYPDKSIKETGTHILLFILTLPIRLLAVFNKGYNETKDCEWEYLLTDNKLKVEKQLCATTGFDDCIRFFILSTSDAKLNDLIRDKYFSDFIIKLDSGIFLRCFKSPKDWPTSSLIYIPFDSYKIETIAKSKSSGTNWTYSVIDNNHIDIVTEHTQDYKKIISVMR